MRIPSPLLLAALALAVLPATAQEALPEPDRAPAEAPLRLRLPSARYVPLPDSTRLAVVAAPQDSVAVGLPTDPAGLEALGYLRTAAGGYATSAAFPTDGRFLVYALTSSGNVYATHDGGTPEYGVPGEGTMVLDLVRDTSVARQVRSALFSPEAEAALLAAQAPPPDTSAAAQPLGAPVAVTPAEEERGIPVGVWVGLALLLALAGLMVWWSRRRPAPSARPLPAAEPLAARTVGSRRTETAEPPPVVPPAPAPPAGTDRPPGPSAAAAPVPPPADADAAGPAVTPLASFDDLAELLREDPVAPLPAPVAPTPAPDPAPEPDPAPASDDVAPSPYPPAPPMSDFTAPAGLAPTGDAGLRAEYDALRSRHERLEAAFLDLARDYERFKRQTARLLQQPPGAEDA